MLAVTRLRPCFPDSTRKSATTLSSSLFAVHITIFSMDRWVTVTKSSTAGRVKNDTKDTKRVSARHHPYARSGVADVDDATQSSTWKEQWNPDVSAALSPSLLKHVFAHQPFRVRAQLSKNGKAPTQARLTKHLLNTLSDSSNPITHSDIYRRTGTTYLCSHPLVALNCACQFTLLLRRLATSMAKEGEPLPPRG